MTYIKQAKAPTLIQHGELDKRVPIPNAYELYQGLQDQGVPAKLIVYKGFGHGLTKPKAHRAAMEHNLEWFGKYIWGEAPPAPAKAAAKVEPFTGIVNFAPVDDTFACAGAVKPEAAAELKRRGYASVVNFRKASEEGAAVEAEKAAVEAAGLKYISIPWTRTDADVKPALDGVPRRREGPGQPAHALPLRERQPRLGILGRQASRHRRVDEGEGARGGRDDRTDSGADEEVGRGVPGDDRQEVAGGAIATPTR